MSDLSVTTVLVSNITLVTPESEAGMIWLNENTNAEGWQWWGGALAVDVRALDSLLDGAIEAGLEVE